MTTAQDRGSKDSFVKRPAGAPTGQAVAPLRWTEICFSFTSDPTELRELLDVSSRSISAFVDGTIAAIAEQIAREREGLTSGSHAERLETVSLLLDGAPIPAACRVAHRLPAHGRAHSGGRVERQTGR